MLELLLWRQFTCYVIGELDDDGHFVVWCSAISALRLSSVVTAAHVLFGPPEGMTLWQSRFGDSIRLVLLALIDCGRGGDPAGGF